MDGLFNVPVPSGRTRACLDGDALETTRAHNCQKYAKEWEEELVCPLNLWRKRASIYVVARWQGMLAVRVIPRLQPRLQPVSLGASLFDSILPA